MRALTDVIGDLNRGRTFHELNQELAKVVEAVKATGKGGSLTFSLKIAPNGVDSVELSADIKTKIPVPSQTKTLMFISADNSLVRSDPRQKDLPLREVGDGGSAGSPPAPAIAAKPA